VKFVFCKPLVGHQVAITLVGIYSFIIWLDEISVGLCGGGYLSPSLFEDQWKETFSPLGSMCSFSDILCNCKDGNNYIH
jgi:hypothetical protein